MFENYFGEERGYIDRTWEHFVVEGHPPSSACGLADRPNRRCVLTGANGAAFVQRVLRLPRLARL